MNEVAACILAQLGGNRLIAMCGAKNFVYGPAMLRFSLPGRFAKGGINRVQINLGGDDLYSIAFYKWMPRKLEMIPMGKVDGVYADMLAEVFSEKCGLDLHL